MRHEVNIALVGKYTQLSDAYASVIKALEHATLACNRRLRLLCVEAEDLEEEAKAERPVKYYEAWQNVCKAESVFNSPIVSFKLLLRSIKMYYKGVFKTQIIGECPEKRM